MYTLYTVKTMYLLVAFWTNALKSVNTQATYLNFRFVGFFFIFLVVVSSGIDLISLFITYQTHYFQNMPSLDLALSVGLSVSNPSSLHFLRA